MPGQSRKAKKYSLGTTKPIELNLPSGNVCLVNRPGVRGLIKAGLLDSLDSLTGLVQRDLLDSNDPKKQAQAAQQLLDSPERLEEGLSIIDRAVCHAVVEPKVLMPPPEGEQRDPEATYADEVDDEDKMFIFNFIVGGTHDIESFRAETQGRLGLLSTGQDVPVPTQ